MTFEANCPRMIWGIDNYSKAIRKRSDSFRYLNADWQWEYVVHAEEIDGCSVEKSAIFLTRLSSICDGKQVKKFFSSVYIKTPGGKKIFEQINTYDIEPRNRWVVFQEEKENIVEKGLIWKDFCIFSCSLEPVGTYEEIIPLETESRISTYPCLQSLCTDFKKLLANSAFTDVTLKCGDMSFQAHKIVLVSRSAKFASLLESVDVRKDDYDADLVIIEDIQPEVLEALISYIYTGSIQLSKELVEKIYRASNEYGIQSLIKRSALFIMENLNCFQPCNILLLAEEFHDDYLKDTVASYIANDLTVLISEDWKEFSDKHKILAIEVFRIFVQRSHLRS